MNSVLQYILFIQHLSLIGAGREFGQKFNVKSGFRTNDSGALLADIPIFVCNYLFYQIQGEDSLQGSSDNKKVCCRPRDINFLTTFTIFRR